MITTEHDGALEDQLRLAIGVAARIGQVEALSPARSSSRAWETRPERVPDLKARLESRRAAAAVELEAVSLDKWWSSATAAEIGRVYETATVWRGDLFVDGVPETIIRQIRERYGVELRGMDLTADDIASATQATLTERTTALRMQAEQEEDPFFHELLLAAIEHYESVGEAIAGEL